MDGESQLLVSWGEFLWDHFPSCQCLGGAPSNVALHLADAGLQSGLITRVGNDAAGAQAILALTDRGLVRAGLQVDEALPTGKVSIEVVQGEPSYTLHPGAWRGIKCDSNACKLLKQARVFCYGTLSQEKPKGLNSFREALEALSPKATRVCDPNLRGGRIDPVLVRELLAAADIVKINDEEAHVLERSYNCTSASQWLLDEMQVRLVAQTHGDKGATLTTSDTRHHHKGFVSGHTGDNVGAGDAFTSILIRGILSKTGLENCLVAANRYASFVAGNVGATPLPPGSVLREIRELLGETDSCVSKENSSVKDSPSE